MKKTAVLIASVILSIFCSLPVFATGNNLPEEKTIGVFAKAVYTLPDGCYGAKKDNDGHYVVELPDGIKITLTSKSDVTSLRMVIFPITKQDKRAYQWISDCTTNCGTNILFYEIYFIDEYGTRVNVKKTLQVNITLPKGYGVPKVAKISTNGSLSQLVSKSDSNKISFTIDKGGYYAVVSARAGSTVTHIFPKTGEKSMINIWIALLFVSGIGVAGTAVYGRKKKYSAK